MLAHPFLRKPPSDNRMALQLGGGIHAGVLEARMIYAQKGPRIQGAAVVRWIVSMIDVEVGGD